MERHEDMIKLLLARGADPSLTNNDDKTPLQVAQPTVLSLLRQRPT